MPNARRRYILDDRVGLSLWRVVTGGGAASAVLSRLLTCPIGACACVCFSAADCTRSGCITSGHHHVDDDVAQSLTRTVTTKTGAHAQSHKVRARGPHERTCYATPTLELSLAVLRTLNARSRLCRCICI